MTTASHMTSCGLPGINGIPYGIHMCHFYESREDLAAALVPYFEAGLRNNERCLWITAEPLPASQAKIAAQNAGMDVEAATRKGALRIVDHAEWFSETGTKAEQIVQGWLTQEARALAQGYGGLRIAGNVSFVTPETWDAFMDYEQAASEALEGRRIVTLCSYRRDVHAAGMLDVCGSHHCTIERPDKGWQILTNL